ncbi:MAG: hypothetical protein Q9219_005264 [cf. Caloplaca sp. 3 TL-2023]
MHEAVAAIAGCGVSPLVRIAANEGWMVKRALDAGGEQLTLGPTLLDTIANNHSPFSAWDHSAFAENTGQRGFGSPFAMERFGGVTQTEYLQQANDGLLTIVQVETREALQNVTNSHSFQAFWSRKADGPQVAEIAQVPGIDVLFCGPFDLGNNIGCPILDGTMHDELKEAIAKIQRVAKENRIASGIYAISGDQARQYADQGFQMISVATDATLLPASLQSALRAAQGSYVHSALNMAKGAFRSY